jgi:hypothetical protein
MQSSTHPGLWRHIIITAHILLSVTPASTNDKMPITFRTYDAASISASQRSETLSTPPLSLRSFDDAPFKPKEDDHVSLSMRKGRRYRHERDANSFPETPSYARAKHRKPTSRPRPSRQTSHTVRKTHSLPTLQPRFDYGTVETFEMGHDTEKRARRWTVPSKAASTCGIAMLAPVDEGSNKLATHRAAGYADPSPAMITLRRATTHRARRHTTSLTSFPPPKFRRDYTGLLTSFLFSITGTEKGLIHATTETVSGHGRMHPRRTSMLKTPTSVHPGTSTAAPPIQTEILAEEPLVGASESNNSRPLRRCSTRLVSGKAVYEVVWDENWSSSSTSSEPGGCTPRGLGSIFPSKELSSAEPLERRLSNALSWSRRTSSQEHTIRDRKFHHAPETDLSFGGIWAAPHVGRLFSEPKSDKPPHSKFWVRNNMLRLQSAEIKDEGNLSEDKGRLRRYLDRVEFFPPLRGSADGAGPRRNRNLGRNNGMGSDMNGSTSSQQDRRQPDRSRSRLGSMVGISSGVKRPKDSENDACRRRSGCTESRRQSQSQLQAASVDDESRPLLTGV